MFFLRLLYIYIYTAYSEGRLWSEDHTKGVIVSESIIQYSNTTGNPPKSPSPLPLLGARERGSRSPTSERDSTHMNCDDAGT
jgi:hypothetical protein